MILNDSMVNAPVTLTALVDDAAKGGSEIASAEYSLDGAAWTPMSAADGAFDEASEDVAWALDPFTEASVMDVCVRGTDAAANTGAETCAMLAVFDPTGGFATGAGWIDSPPGAYTPDDPNVVLSVFIENVSAIFTAEGPGMPVVLPPQMVASTGMRTMVVRGDGPSTFSLDLYRNTALEAQVGDSVLVTETGYEPLTKYSNKLGDLTTA